MNTVALEVGGMTCSACIRHVTGALPSFAGVTKVALDLPANLVRVGVELVDSNGATFITALATEGYAAQLAPGAAPLYLSKTSKPSQFKQSQKTTVAADNLSFNTIRESSKCAMYLSPSQAWLFLV